jgi:hypothetical protein
MAPELFVVIGGTTLEPITTMSSDVYSFALLVLEVRVNQPILLSQFERKYQILTSEAPKGRPNKPIVTAKILAELQPKRADYDFLKVTSSLSKTNALTNPAPSSPLIGDKHNVVCVGQMLDHRTATPTADLPGPS